MQSDGWKPATQKALSSPCYTSISLLKDNTFTRSSFDIFWLRLSKRIDSFLWQRPMDIESFCGREPNFQHGIVWLGLCKLKKIAQFEHLLWLLFPLTAFISQRAPTCLARLNHACAFWVKSAIDEVLKETLACYLSSVVRILDYFHFRPLRTFLCWFVQGDLYQRKRRLPGSTVGTENLLCRDLLNLVINLMLLSVKDVKTLPFEIVYLHTLFPNNTQKLGHILMT